MAAERLGAAHSVMFQRLVSGMLLVSRAQPALMQNASPAVRAPICPGGPARATSGRNSFASTQAMLYDGAILAGGAALQAGAFVWTYRHHTPALSHGVAAVAVSEMLLPLARLAYQHYRGQTPGMPPAAPPGPLDKAFISALTHGGYALKSVWSGVSYGLWLGTLASQLGVASLWGTPLAIGVGVLGATCALAVLTYWVLPAKGALALDVQGAATLLRLKVVALACQVRCRLDDGGDAAANGARVAAEQAVTAHGRCMGWQAVRAAVHPLLWRDELLVGVGLGLWQGARCWQGHIGAKGALSGVMLLFPMGLQVFKPLSCEQAHTGAKASGRWLFQHNDQAHSSVQAGMRLALLSALWAVKPA